MSTISTGIGPISGLPINDLVESLVQIQRRPVVQLQTRLANITSQKAALLKISAQLLAIRNAATRFTQPAFLQATKAASSNEAVVLASATSGAAAGQFNITPRRLATSHQLLSNAFASADSAPIGPGTIVIESARATLHRATPLASLRGGDGVPTGTIRIQDRAGASVDLDLTAASTLDDIVAAINAQTRASVRARIDGDRLVVTDQTGLATGQLVISDLSGSTAADLGLLGSSGAGVRYGQDLVWISEATRLAELNDGNGVQRLRGLADFEVSLADGTVLRYDISGRLQASTPLALLNGGAGVPAGSIRMTNKAGVSQVIDLSQAEDIAGVKAAIEAAGLNISVLVGTNGLKLTDNSTGSRPTLIEEVGNGRTARALGLAGSFTGGAITGKPIYSVETVGDLLRLLNHHPLNNGRLLATISTAGKGLSLRDNTEGPGAFAVTALNDSKAAADLGLLGPAEGNTIQSRRLLAGPSTVLLRSLNGGAGVRTGIMRLTDRSGAVAEVDVTHADSLAEVIAAINASPTGIRIGVSSSGLGIEVSDSSGGAGPLRVEDVSGSTAADLRIAVDSAVSRHGSGNLQRQYISTATRLADFGIGGGFVRGRFRITDSSGASDIVDLTQGDEQTVLDVINEINSRPNIRVRASLNATGDGLLLTDEAQGAGRLKVAEEGGGTARSLGILGEAKAGSSVLDGSLETRIEVGGSDTLNDVLAAIRGSAASVSALVLRDGSTGSGYRLSLTSTRSGRDGAIAVEADSANLSFSTLVQGADAVALFGPANAARPLVLTSAGDTLTDVVPGVRLDLVNTSEQPVTVTIRRDVEAIVRDVSAFVTAYNAALGAINEATRYDAASQSRSVLTGDPTATRVRQRLLDLANRAVEGASAPYNRLAGAGVSFTTGGVLRLDEEKLRAALDANPAALENLFTTRDKGLGAIIEKEMKRLTEADGGLIPIQEQNLIESEELLNKRIRALETLVARRRERLLGQFSATETIIARLQAQQTALSGLSSLTLGAAGASGGR